MSYAKEKLIEAAKDAHELLMCLLLDPQQMEIVCRLNDAIDDAERE